MPPFCYYDADKASICNPMLVVVFRHGTAHTKNCEVKEVPQKYQRAHGGEVSGAVSQKEMGVS